MIDVLLNMDNLPFLVALGLTVALAGAELVYVMVGGGSMGAMGDASPDITLPDGVDIDLVPAGPDITAASPMHQGLDAGTSLLAQSLAWLHLGKLPVAILLVLGLLGFGVTGLIAQLVAHATFGQVMPWWLASVPAIAGMILCLRFAGLLTIRYLPQDETQVVSAESFVGKEAVMVLATARVGQPAQAKLRDRFGQTHYFMVEPRDEQTQLTPNMRILVIHKEGSTYKAIVHPLISGAGAGTADSSITPKES